MLRWTVDEIESQRHHSSLRLFIYVIVYICLYYILYHVFSYLLIDWGIHFLEKIFIEHIYTQWCIIHMSYRWINKMKIPFSVPGGNFTPQTSKNPDCFCVVPPCPEVNSRCLDGMFFGVQSYLLTFGVWKPRVSKEVYLQLHCHLKGLVNYGFIRQRCFNLFTNHRVFPLLGTSSRLVAGAMDLGPSVSKWVRDPQDFELLAVCHRIHGIHGTNRIFTYTFTINFNQM